MEVGWYRQAKQRGQRPKPMGHKHGNSLNHKLGNLDMGFGSFIQDE